MFERFTAEARDVIVKAQAAAVELNHGYIGTEHLLLGVVREGESAAARSLLAHGVTEEAARRTLLSIIGRGEGTSGGQIPFTPRAKKALELALRESLSLGSEIVTPEHLLLGLLREGDGVCSRILRELGVDTDALREEVLSALPKGEPWGREALRRVRQGRALATPEISFHVEPSAELWTLLMSAAARALEAGRSEIEIADLEEALRRRRAPGEKPPEAA